VKKAAIVAALFVVLTLALAGTALAAQQAPASGSKKDASARLEQVKKRIAKRIERVEKMKAKALARASKADARLKKAIDTLKAQGKDTSKLVADREVALSKIETAKADFDALVKKMKEAQGLVTAATLEQLKAAQQAAKELGMRVRSDVKDIRQYAKTVLLPEIRSLKGTNGGGKKQTNTSPAF
jgi:hypothetical protein